MKTQPGPNHRYSVVFYCPDDHVAYNLNTLENEGIGGGITARIRMAHALSENGHDVTIFVNCSKNGVIKGVRYIHFSKFSDVKTEVLIASTSGGTFDLSAFSETNINAKIKILMVHGVEPPKGCDLNSFDFVYAPSNFIRHKVAGEWKFDPQKIFVSHHGVQGRNFKPQFLKHRNPFNLVYFGHPSKGLDACINVLRILRKTDPRYKLHIFGGSRLWGGQESPLPAEPGLIYHGLVGQKELAKQLQKMTFSLNLQTREEPFGMVITDSMRAGCVVIASPVGAYPELIQHGVNGFLIDGDPNTEETQLRTASLIRELAAKPEIRESISQNARNTPMDWSVFAKSWEGHWDQVLNPVEDGSMPAELGKCSECGGGLLPLADGLHCTNCGNYLRTLPE